MKCIDRVMNMIKLNMLCKLSDTTKTLMKPKPPPVFNCLICRLCNVSHRLVALEKVWSKVKADGLCMGMHRTDHDCVIFVARPV